MNRGRNYSYFSVTDPSQLNNNYPNSTYVFDYSNNSYQAPCQGNLSHNNKRSANDENNLKQYNADQNSNCKKPKLNDLEIDLTKDDKMEPQVWSVDLYNYTMGRTLNKDKFISPASLTGSVRDNVGSYNYSYYNYQTVDKPEIIDYNYLYQPKPILSTQKKITPLLPMKDNSNVVNRKSFIDKQTIHINSIFLRSSSSKNVIILRGLPGSGKSSFCQAFKNKEIEMGRVAPRILSLDPFFTEDGKFEYEPEMEEIYVEELFRTFKRQIDEGYFSMFIVDSVNYRISQFRKFYTYAEMFLFRVCVLEFKISTLICAKRSELKYDPMHINNMSKAWENLPIDFCRLDASSFLQDASIEDVEMEDMEPEPESPPVKMKSKKSLNVSDDVVDLLSDSESESGQGQRRKIRLHEDSDDENEDEIDEMYQLSSSGFFKSKWDEDLEETKDRLDGMKTKHEHETVNIFELIQKELEKSEALSNEKNKKKRVKWADFEQMKVMQKRKQLGFSATTNWSKMNQTDMELAEQALVQIKYYEKDNSNNNPEIVSQIKQNIMNSKTLLQNKNPAQSSQISRFSLPAPSSFRNMNSFTPNSASGFWKL